MKQGAIKIAEGIDPLGLIQREEGWYNDAVREIRDRWEPKIDTIKLPTAKGWTVEAIRTLENRMDDLSDKILDELAKVKSIHNHLTESKKALSSVKKVERKKLFQKEESAVANAHIAAEFASMGLDDAMLIVEARLEYLKMYEARMVRKKEMLNIGKGQF